ncbi:unnamed protein product, partial [Allacma fusca]
KAVKAALVLLPLLGLTNLLNMMDAPLERSAAEFGLWSYTTHAFTSCQGLILACLYCFLNGEVRLALKKFFRYELFNGNKKRGSGCGKGSGRLSVMNNSVGGRRSSSVGEPSRRNDLFTNHPRRNTQFMCLNNVLSSSNPNSNVHRNYDEALGLTEIVTNLTSDTVIRIESDGGSSGGRKNGYCTSSTMSSKDSQNSPEFRNETSQLNRSNLLRIWVSPFSLLSGNTIIVDVPKRQGIL